MYNFIFIIFSVTNLVDDKLLTSLKPENVSSCPVRLYVLDDVSKLKKYQGREVNIDVVYSSYPSAYMKVFYNGVFFKSVPINSTYFGNLRSNTAYLGRNNFTDLNNGGGLDAQFNEFRIYFGELSKSDAQALFLVGTDPSHVTVSSENTISDIYLTFYSTSLVDMNIEFYGGSPGPSNSSSNSTTSFLYSMFGSETSFQLNPANETCKYRPKFSLDPLTSSVRSKVPAMNYTITLLDNSLPAPKFSSTSCPADTPCFCGTSKSPFQYMTEAALLNQSFSVNEVNKTVHNFQYLYRTGLCYEAKGSEQFSSIEGSDKKNDKSLSCFKEDVFYMDKADGNPLKSKKVTVKLFEKYPEGVTWFTLNNEKKYVANEWKEPPLINWFMENSQLVVLDQISGSNSNVAIDYNINKSLSRFSRVSYYYFRRDFVHN